MSNQILRVFSLNCLTDMLFNISVYPHSGKLSAEKQGKISKTVATYFVEVILWVIFSEAEKDAHLLILMEYEEEDKRYQLGPKRLSQEEQNRQNEEVQNTPANKVFSVKDLAHLLTNDPVYIPADIIVINQKEAPSKDWVKYLIKKILRIILWELESEESPLMGWVSIDDESSKFWLKPVKFLLKNQNQETPEPLVT